jgi:hypothetical protein
LLSVSLSNDLQVFAWKNAYDISEVVIPTLKELIEEQEVNLKTALSMGRTATVKDVMERLMTLTRTLTGWQGVLKRVADLYETAETSSEIKPVKNLVPESLITDKAGKDNARFINGSLAPNSNELRDISAISFVGGGASITYVEDETLDSKESTSTETVKDRDTSGGVITDSRIAVVAFDISLHIGSISSESSNKLTGTEKSSTSARSFTLSDPDVGDSFDVKVRSSDCLPHVVLMHCAGVPRPCVWHAVLPHQKWTQQVWAQFTNDGSHNETLGAPGRPTPRAARVQ